MKPSAALLLPLLSMLTVGCGYDASSSYMTPARLDEGLVIILPGIEGEGPMNRDIRRGLEMAGIRRALPIYHWGRPVPGIGMILNQMDFIGNRLAGASIAKMIEQYQAEHPDAPVYLVGHSGGGGVAVFAAEGMPEGKQVDGLVLLSASIWSGYDLTKALSRCRSGIANFYNESDIGLLGIGTTITSNVDGMRGPSAGLIGFETPKPGDSEAKKLAYGKLFQIPIVGDESDPHAAATRPGFVSARVAPWVASSDWPAGRAARAAGIGPAPPEAAKALAMLHRR